ncbi:uncharacterized protein LOC123524047 [Mercenaria mercenaria]|uniref:uncharacterized protein LOC123524047 n=1 Tax=Mercenaria mercenaria TaxID=6596 RepID=UPI00234F7D27|nr:uncharacterized protein LOC123524047 [Mercenaria mercenaria]
MGDNSGAHGAPGHFNNDTSRHTEVNNSRNNVQGMFLFDQQEPYTGEDMPTVPVQVNTVYGQARIVQIPRGTLDAEAEGDGSVSIPYVRQNGSSSGQQEQNSQAIAATLDTASPVDPAVPHQQPVSSLLGVTRQGQGPSLPNGILQDDLTYHAQSCSGLSDVNINRLAPQLQEVLSNDSSAVQLHRQEILIGPCAQQTLSAVSEDHGLPLNIQVTQADLTAALGVSTGTSREKEQTLMPPKFPQQCSEATAARHISDPDIIFPPNQQNERKNYVRAENTEALATDQERTESRIPGNEGGAMRSSSLTPSSRYRTARGSSVSQGGGDIDNTSMQSFVSAAQHGPCHQKYANTESRFVSFLNIPETVTPSLRSLAEAGMFYAGYKDTCRCFFCDGVLHSWKPGDDPWQEHARHYPNCGFVKKEKGQDYIDFVKLTFSQSKEETKVKDSGSCKLRSKETDAIVQRIEEMGYGREKILLAVEECQRRVQAGRIQKGADTMNAVLDILSEESDLAVGHQSQSTDQRANRMVATDQRVNRMDVTDQRANRMDARYCCACKRQKATVSQQKCGHIVCWECAPRPGDQIPRCRYCLQEVIECNPIDTAFFH